MVKKSKKKSRGGGGGVQRRQPTGQELYDAAQEALEMEDIDAARQFLHQAVKTEPTNVELLDAYGSFLAEFGPEEEALRALKYAVQLAPEQGHAKYMYLGQLLEGEEAVTAMRKGVEILQRKCSQQETAESADPAEVAEDRAALCGALCALAEALMHNALDVAEVADEVFGLLERARALQSNSPEPLLALASLRCETGNTEEALHFLKQSLQCWLGKTQQAADEDEEEEEDVEVEDELKKGGGGMEVDEEDDLMPSYEFRLETAKLLIELDDTTETAIQVLEGLIEETDSVPEVWHILGLAYYGGGLYDEATEACQQGQKLVKKLEAEVQQSREDKGREKEKLRIEELRLQFEDLLGAITEAKGANTENGVTA